MKKVAIVSCDRWKDKIDEDKLLKAALNNNGIAADIISWQTDSIEGYDLLVLRSVWGYQNDYFNFKKWLSEIEKKRIHLENQPSMILNNIDKEIQFDILQKNDIDYIKTLFVKNKDFSHSELKSIIGENVPYVLKPTISGSGENTFLIDPNDTLGDIPNKISMSNAETIFSNLFKTNSNCNLMIQPYVSEIQNGEYSCIFIDGELTHTMLRFPNIFHDKKHPYLVKPPKAIIDMANKVERIKQFEGYLYMRVDMVLINNQAKIMEVELAEPDLLIKYVDDLNLQDSIVKTFARKIERRIK